METISYATIMRDLRDARGNAIEEDPTPPDSVAAWNARFKVCDLKLILKECRRYGYQINMHQNKNGLSNRLHEIFSGACAVDAAIPPPLPPPSSHSGASVPQSLSRGFPTAGVHAPSSNTSYTLNSSSLSMPPPARPDADPSAIRHSVSPRIPSATTSVAAPVTATASATASIAPYRAQHDELLTWGFSSSQLVAAIRQRVSRGEAVTQELLVVDLLGSSEPPPMTEEDEKQFEKDMDAAIFNSEDGREHIQMCKKQRSAELKTDPSCLICNAKEFRSSYLLGNHQEVMSSTSSSSTPLGKVKVVREIASFLDSLCGQEQSPGGATGVGIGAAPGSAAGMRGCGVGVGADGEDEISSIALQELRSAAVELLDLEAKSFKWYKDRALGYFMDMEQKICTACQDKPADFFHGQFRRYVTSRDSGSGSGSGSCSGSSNNESGSSQSWEGVVGHSETQAFVGVVLRCLREEAIRLSTDLYAFSTSSVPQAFLDCDLDRQHETRYCIEDDGFEIL